MKKITLNVINLPSHCRDHSERAVLTYPTSIIILFIIAKFLYVLISQFPNSPSWAILKYTFTRYFNTLNT